MQEKRISRNIALEEVAEATGISVGVLKTLESNDREKLPAEVYIKAFYKKYAKYLELDPEELLSAYQQQSERQSKTGGRYKFSTVITLKGQGENLFAEIARRLFMPIIVVDSWVNYTWRII